ncbi:uncharacterized protein LOC122257733 isoform X2 [Penaeus japonicus]|uniref:uncharacterized protein LOC122257733 isoform X2 n=1 Tax=Penaeus japonicus TaxID=27405 RepID=UPI001C714EC2|nr:uncharacterized protein LOC122257733 isoform X2 [Penaeus japonicus]
MDPQSQFSLSHILGQAVDVTSYSTFQHQLHGYGNINTIGNIANIGNSAVTPTGHPVSIQDMVPAGQVGGSGVVTMGYAHHPQATAPLQSYHAVFNNVGVAHVNPQVQAPQVQYFSYESSAVAVRTPPLHASQHPQVTAQTANIQGQRYGSCNLPVQVVTSSVPVSNKFTVSKSRTGDSSSSKIRENDGLKKRKLRKEGVSAKVARKSRRNRGESYINAAGKLVEAKKYVDKDCECKNKCLSKLGSVTDRENIFKSFWDIGDFSKQNAYLTENVILVPNVKRKQTQPLEEKNGKTVSRLYYVRLSNCSKQTRICKTMFLRLHGVSNGRLDRILQAVNCQIPNALQDKRGQHTPSNKTSQEDWDLVTQHIWSVRCSQEEGSENPIHNLGDLGETTGKDLSVKKMYEMYKRWCEERGKVPVSLWVYRHIEKSWTNKESVSARNPPVVEAQDVLPASASNLLNDGSEQTREQVPVEGQKLPELSRKKRNGERVGTMTRIERKVKRNSGAAYYTAAGKLKEEKHYVDKQCGCKYRCIPEIGSEETRRQVFMNFWKFGDFTKQNEYIAQKVVLVPVMQRERDKVPEKFTRTYTRIYNVQMKPSEKAVRVCKTAFLQLHGVSNGRVDRVLQAVACESPFALKDRRGNHSPKNKTKQEDVEYICQHIKAFPMEPQHHEANNRHALPQDLNVEKMYRMYKQQCVQDNRTPVSSFVYRKILKERV